jgi:hypothetical protein
MFSSVKGSPCNALQVVQQQKFKNGLKQGNTLLPLLFNFSLECAIWRVQVNHEIKLNDRYWFLLMMLIYRAEAYKYLRKTQKLK